MGLFSKFEGKMEDTFEGAADSLSNAPISPVQVAKKCEKQMRRERMVGAGKEYAPTLYTVLVNPGDDERLFGYYPTLAGETETYLSAKAAEEGLVMDGQPLVRFVVDDSLKHGKFDVIAETVSGPIVSQLRAEEMARYGLAGNAGAPAQRQGAPHGRNQAYAPSNAYADPYAELPEQGYEYSDPQAPRQRQADDLYFDDYDDNGSAPAQQGSKPPLPYVPEDEIDYSIDYGEYTFDSNDFDDYRTDSERLAAHGARGAAPAAAAGAVSAAGAAAGAAGAQAQIPAQQARAQAPRTVAFAGAGAPDRAAVRARLIDLAYQRAFDLAGSRITIGRESDNDIVVQDINASRKHAELSLSPQGFWIVTDLKSTNGTVVNGRRVASQPLNDGDRITIGKTEFEFVQG